MSVGERIRELRKKNCLSQEELADKLNVSRQSIQKWETDANMPSVEAVKCMSCFFNVDINYLINGTVTNNFKDNDNQESRKHRFKKTSKIFVSMLILILASIFSIIYYFVYIYVISPYTFVPEKGEILTGLMAYILGPDADKTPIVLFCIMVLSCLSSIFVFILWVVKNRKKTI